jgi:peptide/nickel transport system substrate-binding protein
VTFSNGNPFNADDVVFTINRANNRPGASDLLGDCDETQTKKIDDYTVEVNFTKYSVGMETGTWTSIYMFDAESFSEDKVTTETIGTGPTH